MRTVVFDLDGTLADTSGDLLAAANACFRALGHGDLLGPADAATALLGGRAMLRLGFARLGPARAGAGVNGGLGGGSEAEVDAQYPVLLEAYGAAIDTHTRLYPGAVAAVEALRRAGYATAICTNKPERLAETLLCRLGVRPLFGALIGADTLPVRKPHPQPLHEAIRRVAGDPARSLLVGDTETDRATGRNAGIPVALVTFGPGGQDVARLAPEALLHRFDDLPALADRLLPV